MKSLSKGVEVIKKEPNENYRIENSITEIRKTSLHGLNSRTEDDRDTISDLVGRQQNSPNLKKQRKQTEKKMTRDSENWAMIRKHPTRTSLESQKERAWLKEYLKKQWLKMY